MDGNQILLLGLGIEAPWKLVDQRLDTDKQPHELHLTIKAERGSKYACPVCGEACAAHDFQEKTWRHLNFFQHHCYGSSTFHVDSRIFPAGLAIR